MYIIKAKRELASGRSILPTTPISCLELQLAMAAEKYSATGSTRKSLTQRQTTRRPAHMPLKAFGVGRLTRPGYRAKPSTQMPRRGSGVHKESVRNTAGPARRGQE
jgi:hypothetical protein